MALMVVSTDDVAIVSNLIDSETDESIRRELAPLLLERRVVIKVDVALSVATPASGVTTTAAASAPVSVASTPAAIPSSCSRKSGDLIECENRSSPSLSGSGKSFSNPAYTLCGEPPGLNAVPISHEFQLVGDRACNAYSTCTFAPQKDRICYSFTLQGHDEIPTVFENDGRRSSIGVLRVVYRVPA